MSSKYYEDSAEVGLLAKHHVYGEVELVGRVEHDGMCRVWVVKCLDKDGELKLVDEDDLTDFYYWGDRGDTE